MNVLFTAVFAVLGLNTLTHAVMQVYPNYKDHPCKRTCTGISRQCVYNFTLEWLWSMEPVCGNCMNGSNADCNNVNCVVADGMPRQLMTYNRQLPGPSIEVCENDNVIVYVHNDLDDVEHTLHWHGMDQVNRYWQDGVPFVTQCPIHRGTTWKYDFIASPSGTHWGHSHMGYQRVTGAFFPLIVRKAVEPQRYLYDYDLSDHVMSVIEWHSVMPQIFNMRINRMRIFEQFMTSLLINGFGANSTNNVPPKRFNVTRGSRYRFRLIGAQSTVCPVEMKIDNHRFTVISTDGHDIVPVTVDTLYINPGERIDFVVNATQSAMLYYINFRGLIDCEGITGRALLAYAGASNIYSGAAAPDGVMFNCINRPVGAPNCISMYDVRSLRPLESALYQTPTYKYWFAMDTYDYALPRYQGVRDNEITTPAINNISWTFPSTPLFQGTAGTNLCNWETTNTCRNASPNEFICSCVHMLEIPLNAIVEFIFVDEGRAYDLSHPMHLHGQSFRVIGMDQLGSSTTVAQLRQMDAMGLLRRNPNFPVQKDTISVPDGGYTIIRFQATNPGYWFLHCHVEHHAEEGMILTLKVGTPPAVPANFPRCGNYLG